MSLLVGEVIQRIQSAYSKGVQSKDTRLTDMHIYSAAISARATLLRQQSNSNQHINRWSYQDIPLTFALAPIHEVAGAPEGCNVLKSNQKIPALIADMDDELVAYLVTIDGSIRFSQDDFHTVKYAKGNKYTANKPKFYTKNEYIYLTIVKILKAGVLSGLFQDPIEVQRLCDDCACKSNYELEFFFDRNLLTPLTDLACKELVLLLKQIKEDRSDNASDDTSVQGSMIHQNGE